MRRLTALLVALPVLVTPPPVRAPVADKVKVVTSLTTYGAIAREIVGDRGIVNSIATGDENPHYVQPKPSFVPLLGQADVFVTTGLDLELWVPALLDKANNPKVTEGGPGYVAAYAGIDLLDVPTSYSRSQGDIHVYGNPHIWTSPLNAVQIARNILTGLKRVSPENADYFSREYDVPCVDYIEPKPGIPPTPGHVLEVINEMRTRHISVLLSTNYYDHNQVMEVAQKTTAKAAIVPSNTGGAAGINTYFDLMNLWISELARAFGTGTATAN